jgi:hypothetical protein
MSRGGKWNRHCTCLYHRSREHADEHRRRGIHNVIHRVDRGAHVNWRRRHQHQHDQHHGRRHDRWHSSRAGRLRGHWPAECSFSSHGWCADVVTHCNALNPKNTNQGFCEDMGTICENENLSPCKICEVLWEQCRIERAPTVDCEQYAETCACILDAHGKA